MPTVSVCLPVYNGERYLREAIESVQAQTYQDYELLISDDQSNDSSLDIARDYARRDQRIIVWSNPQNLGLFENYNACMNRASGKYIKLFAQDDLLAPNMLARGLEALSTRGDVALVCTRRVTMDEHGQTRKINEQLDSSRLIAGDEVIKGCMIKVYNWIGEPSAVMFPASRMGSGFDASYYHLGDLEYWFRIVAGGNLVFLNEPLCSFRFHPGSATSRNMKSLLFSLDALRLGRMYKQHLIELGVEEDDYVRRVIDFGGWFVHTLVRKDGVTCEESASLEIAGADKDRMLTQFRELAFYALYYAHDAHLRAEAARTELDHERHAAEDRLRDVLNNSAWRAAQSLRLT